MTSIITKGVALFSLGLLASFAYSHISLIPEQSQTSQIIPQTQTIPGNWVSSSIPTGTSSSVPPTSQSSTAVSPSISGTTTNWAGYAATGGTFRKISGTWTVPLASGSGETAADATWIGIGGIESDDLIQTGTQNVVTPSGQVSSSAFFEMLPDDSETIPNVTVNPGDSVTATLSETGNELWTISFTDNTNGESYSSSVDYNSSLSSAEWIEEDPSDGNNSQIPLDNFGTVTFTDGSTIENGTTKSLANSNAQALTMVNDQGEALTTTSVLNANGTGFSVSRTSASTVSAITQFNNQPGSWRRHGEGIGSQGNGEYGFPSGGNASSFYHYYHASLW